MFFFRYNNFSCWCCVDFVLGLNGISWFKTRYTMVKNKVGPQRFRFVSNSWVFIMSFTPQTNLMFGSCPVIGCPGVCCVFIAVYCSRYFCELKAWKLLSQHEVYCQVFAPAKHSPSSQSLPRIWKEAFHLVPLELDKWPRIWFVFAAVVVC